MWLALLIQTTLSVLWDHQIYLVADNDLEYFSIQDMKEAWTAFDRDAELRNGVRLTALYDRAAQGVRNAVNDPVSHLYRSSGQQASSSEQRFSQTKLIRYDVGLRGWREVTDMG